MEDSTKVDRARILVKIEKIEKELYDKTSKLNVHNKVINHYQGFDQVIFYLSENGNENMESIKRMNTYEFYRYKQMVGEKIRSMNNDIKKMKNGSS